MSRFPAEKINGLLLRLFREPGLLDRLHADREALFEAEGLTEDEKDVLRDGSFGALDKGGVHPILRMHYQMATNPAMGELVSVKNYLSVVEREKAHG